MKKQLLFLILALIASNQIFAQYNPPSCTGDALKPSVGQQYQYTVTIPSTYTGYNGDGTYQWWVTQDPKLLSGTKEVNASEFTASGTGFTYDSPVAAMSTISVTWNGSSIGTGNYYLIVRYNETNTNATLTCASENIKVFMITPQNTFWLKIENVADATGATGGAEHCAPDITGATVTNTTSPGTVQYMYGATTHFIKVSANGYTGNFDGKFRLPKLPTGMGYGNITWTSTSVPAGGTLTPSDTTGGIDITATWPSVNTFIPDDPSTTSVNEETWGTGEVIILTIPIHHNHHETVADKPLAFAVDGSFTVATTTYNDLGSNVCTDEVAFADFAETILRARPGVNQSTPTLIPSPTTVTP